MHDSWQDSLRDSFFYAGYLGIELGIVHKSYSTACQTYYRKSYIVLPIKF